ncbi:FBP1-like protein [Mya arenaria]|uniref:FBP1-like protein n=1 Tax=Mya arenaria TaxID=6604 RepID=A0ABY7DJS2_MYAAR|nr:FBP1-like protein [Mya arenaria]
MAGGPNATCMDNGEWEGLPACSSSSCPELRDDILPNGKLEIIGGNAFSVLSCPIPSMPNAEYNLDGEVNFGDSLTVSCKQGFQFRDRSENTPFNMNCQANQTFDMVDECIDIDECEAGTSGCNLDSTACRNTIGDRECICKDGFHNPIGVSCSALKCPGLPNIQNGWYLTSENQFHFNKEVDIHCEDGYFFASGGTTTSVTDGKLTCTDAGGWDITPSCSPRECISPVQPPLNGMYDTEKVVFGEQLTLTCNLSESEQVTRQAICLYNGTDKGVVFGGDDITVCPEINCGDPDDVMPQAGTYAGNIPPTFTYWPETSKFTFDCSAGSRVTGKSEDEDMDVKCKANGRWSLGSLGCLGEMCMDPGTPGDANQVASSYEIDATLSYACTRTGFKPTGPENYTCEYNNDAAVWSGNLDNVLPTCEDITKPTYDKCQTEPQTAFKMESADFDVPTFIDNFAIKSVSKTGLARPADVLTSNETVTYTANDFNGNSATCSSSIVVSERKKPSIDCPSEKIFSVAVRTETVYNVSDWKPQFYQEVDAHTTELLSIVPKSVTTAVSKIGASDEIVVTVGFTDGANVGEKALCKFRVFYEAGACFEESLFNDSFANTNCTDTAGGGLQCTRTCMDGYVFGNGGTSKTFICSSPNTWDFNQADPRNRYCLPIQNSDDTIDVQVIYDYDFLNHNCFGNFFNKVNGELSTFESNVGSSCNLNWEAQVVTAALVQSAKFSATLKLTLLSSATTTEKNICLHNIRNNSALFNFGNTNLQCGTTIAAISVDSADPGDIKVTCKENYHFKVTSADLAVDVCVPCGPGLINSSTSQSCEACPDGQYQDNNMQTSCLSCSSGSYPSAARTNCKVTCPTGYTSTDGFYPCTPCPADSYSVNTTTCVQCQNGGSTVGVPAASSAQQSCKPCPQHHYQATPGMTYCDPCSTSHMTLQTGSVNNTFCLLIEGCNSAYCNDRGTCETAFGRKNCQCNTGYYGEQCESIYHICNGNPCTNGGTCVPGDGPMDYTCTCMAGFTGDKCEVDNIDNCNNSQCHENSRCVDKINGYECICSSGGFGAVVRQQIPVMIHHANMEHANLLTMFDMNALARTDDCNAHPDACMYGGTCDDRVNGYECNCMTGFTGEHCENVPNYCLPGDCQEGNVCYTSLDAHDGVCSCDTRFFEPVFICDMQDTAGKSLGDPEANAIGGVRIVQSIQECKNLCQYEPDCGHAIYQEFAASKACLLYNRGTINETDNAASTLIKKDCSIEGIHYDCNRNANPCDKITCDNNGTCSDNGYVATCLCAAGFLGSRCQYSVDDCVNNNCQNGAVCEDGYLGFTCECLAGYEGNQCETNTDDCPGLCNSTQGTCQDLVNGYDCVCEAGYQGSNCELEIDECLSYPCTHGADCEDMVNDYSCMCEEGWTGKNCDTEIDHCKSRTCQNSGQCFNLPESSFCRCEGGALGENCENATLVCDVMSGTDVCQNRDYDVRRCYFDEGSEGRSGGQQTTSEPLEVDDLEACKTRCLDNPKCDDMVYVTIFSYCYLYEREKFVSTPDESTRVHYRRICPTDYTGDSCEQVKDWCSDENNPCENGGECTPKGPVGYTCMCKPGYSGVTCNIDADPCSTTPCAGVAKCQSTDYMYWISVSRRGIGVKTNMSPWLGVTFNEDFGSELGDGSWHHLGIAINENGMLSATLDAITIDDAVEVVSPPAGEKNVQISLGYLNLAEYQDVSVWNVTLTSRDFALASYGTQPSVNPIQGWWNYDPKTSGMRLTKRLLHNLLEDPNINFPQMNCDGFENIMHVSAERVVDRDTFVGKIEEVKENTNGTLTFKHSLPPSLTWGFYETVIVGMNSNTLNYGECRVQLVVKYNDECPAARSDNAQIEVCPSGADAVCDLACLEPNKALFAPVPEYISCGTLGVWDTRKPYDDLVLPGCTIKGDPMYAVTSMMKFKPVIPCGNLDILTKVTVRLNDVLSNDVNGKKWTGLCTGAINMITAVDGGETSVLDALRIIILLEKDLNMEEIASASLLEDTVEITMEEVCGEGYALMMNENSRACVPCGPGWKFNSETKECVLCDYGHYQNGSAKTECIPCGNDKWTNFRGARDENECIKDCFPGYVRNPQNLTECVRCNRGTFRSTQDDCVPCTDGKYTLEDTIAMDSSNCDMDICDFGEFWNVSASNCQKCDFGYYQNEMYELQCKMCASDYSTKDMGAQNDSFCESVCSKGEYIKNGACEDCPQDQYSDEVLPNSGTTCSSCTASELALAGPGDGMYGTNKTGSSSSDCKRYCAIGYGRNTINAYACDICERGFFSDNSADTRFYGCQQCQGDANGDRTTNATGATSSDDDCSPCLNNGIFETGTTATGVSNSDDCTPFCPSGYIINGESTGCDPCSRGSYKNNEDSRFAAECTVCPEGTTTDSMASTHSDNCSIHTYSTEELPTSETECMSCTDECDLCETRGTEAPGASSVEECKVICAAGKEYIESSNTCDDCSRGTFKEDADRFGMCKNCTNSDYTTPGEGAMSNDECDIRACAPGYKINGPNCEECPLGTYQNQSYQSFCYPCGTNLNTEGPASDSANDCQLYCSAGKRLTPDETGCEPCGVRFYKPDAGNTECLECDDGLTTDREGQASCTKPWCVPGKYLSGEECVLCAEGSYKASHGNDVCTECASGFTTSRNGSTAVLECDTGQKEQCSLCPVNTYQPGVGETMCINCEAGQITLEAKSTMNTDCVPLCGKGEQYNAVTKECDKCVKGKYKDVEGNTEMCMMCPTDKTTLGTGSTDSSDCSQTLCPIGTYYKVTAGTTQCIPCEKDQCKAGNGFDTFDQTCKICRPGEYNDAMGNNADFCKQCPSGKTSTQSGASACNVVVDDPVIEEKQVNIPMRLVFFVALDSCDDTSNLKIIYDLILNTIRTLFNAISNSSYNNNKRGFCRGNKCDNLVFVGLSTCGARGNSAGRRRRAADTEITVDFALKNNDEIVFGDLSNITETPLCNPGEKRNNELCENCPAGSSGTDGLVCSQCGTGQYQDVVGQTSCKACPEKTFNNKNGSTTADDCLPICGPGKQFNNVSCDMCPIGTYKSVEGNAAMCEPCPSGFTTENQGATSRNDCSQRECEPGTYHVQNSVPITCTDCPIGTYSTASMVTQCTPCGTGKTTLATKSTSADACTTLCSNGRGLNLQTRGCDTCPVGQYNDASSGANPNFCKTCKSGTTNYQTGQSSCPATVDAVVYQYRKYEVMLKYKADIAGCHVDISGIQTQVSLAIRQTFISQRVARYNGQRSFCPSTTCNNIAVDFDKGTNCKLVTRRRKRALDYELDFLVSLSNISNVITDSVQNEEMMAKDIILLILNQNAAQLQPSTLAGIVQYDSIVTIASKEICTSGNELRGDVCNPCTLGHYGTDGETCKPCAADRYQDETGQADCKLCPANTYNDDFGATGPLACKVYTAFVDYCTTHPLSCNNGGKCVATGRRTFTCNCYENYGGQYCNEKKTPTSNMPVILGAAIGGGGALLIIILVVVGCYKYLSVKDKREKKPDHRYGEFDQPMFVGTYDNVGFNGSMPRPIAPYPSIGYPSLGYKPQETSFDHGSITSPYRMRPGVNGDPIDEDDAQYIWTA